ncbi:MAG: ribonuclease III [Candidatus Dadabacteria bacterium]|nr:MAG: ribonuclease III [Candidatus Dadabacteria bacterium]
MERRENLRDLEEALGYLFETPDLLDQALTHKSYANERGSGIRDNERLEFLGDAVLDLVVSHLLYDLRPPLTEGKMSKVRAFLVSEPSLAEVARSFGLGRYLLLGKGEEQTGGREKPSILSGAFEALVAAIYLDGGFDLAREFVDAVFRPLLEAEGPGGLDRDFKTRLQEHCQGRYGTAPTYRLVGEWGPDHDKTFEVEIRLGNRVLGRGRGRSKKEAEQRAAQGALDVLE